MTNGKIALDATTQHYEIKDTDQYQSYPACFQRFFKITAIGRKTGQVVTGVEPLPCPTCRTQSTANGMRIDIRLNKSTVDLTHIVRFVAAAYKGAAHAVDGSIAI